MHSGEWRLLPLFSVAACDFLLCLSSLSPFSLSRSLLFFFSVSLLSTFYFALFLFHPGSSCLLSLRIFTFLFFVVVFFTSLLTVFSPSHSPFRVRYFRFLYLNPAVSCTFSLRFVFSFFLFSLSTPNKASRSPNDCFKHLDSTVGYLGNAKFWCTESK